MIKPFHIFESRGGKWVVDVENLDEHGQRSPMSSYAISEINNWNIDSFNYSNFYVNPQDTWGQVFFKSREDAFIFYLSF